MGATQWLKSRVQAWVDSKLDPGFRAKLKALPTRQNEYGYDPFGFHRDEAKVAALVTRFLYRSYFRVEAHGIENVPDGPRPARLQPLRPAAVRRRRHRRRAALRARSAAHRARHGRALRADGAVRLVPVRALGPDHRHARELPPPARGRRGDPRLPRGRAGISKPFTQRYQLQEFGLGFMRLALETGTPIVPVAVIGAEEQAPAVNLKPLAKLLGAPAFPVMPLPPFFPILPLPDQVPHLLRRAAVVRRRPRRRRRGDRARRSSWSATTSRACCASA